MSHSRKKKTEKDAARFLIIVASAAASLFLAAILLKQPTPSADDNCLTGNEKTSGTSVILIDITDEPSGLFRDELQEFVTETAQRVQEFRKLRIYGLADSTPVPLFEKCAPGNPTPMDHVGKSRESVRLQQEQQKQFAEDAANQVLTFLRKNATKPHSNAKSRIIRSIHDIISTSMISGARFQHLIVYSDLLENSEITSFYDGADKDRLGQAFQGPFSDLLTSFGQKTSGISFSICQVLPPAGSLTEKMAGTAGRFWFELLDPEKGRSKCLDGLSKISGANSGCKPEAWKCGQY